RERCRRVEVGKRVVAQPDVPRLPGQRRAHRLGRLDALLHDLAAALAQGAHHQLRVAGGVFDDEDAEDAARHYVRSRRYWPVTDAATRATLSGVPWATTRPPASPAPGPKSMIQSARFTTSRWCSITSTVCPAWTSRSSTRHRVRTSSRCRPVVGSSRM